MNRTSARAHLVTILCLCAVFFQGCTKDKAEAIKVAAETFRAEAASALYQIRDVLKANIALPPPDNAQLLRDLNVTNFSYAMLEHLLTEDQIGQAQADQVDRKIEELTQYYLAFAHMFDSLPQGHFFAKEAVAAAERHAVNLSVQMINLAKLIQEQKIPVRLNAKRILLVEQITQHNSIPDEKIKREHLKNASQQIASLAKEEAQLRAQAIAQCLKAAEAGRLVAGLIRDYRTLSLGEILAQTQQSLGFVAELSGQNPDVVALLDRFSAVESAIRADPHWSTLLDRKLDITPHD